MMTVQAQAAADAGNLQQGQDVVVNALQQRMNITSGVNVDQEMTNLLTLQNAYAANARVFSTCRRCSKPCSRCEAIMSVSGVGTTAAFMTQSLIDLRRQLDDLQRQISTGRRSFPMRESARNRSSDRLNSQLNAVSGFQNSNNIVTRGSRSRKRR